MTDIILGTHILGALIVGGIILVVLRDVYRDDTLRLPRYARSLSIGLFFQIVSGSALTLLTPGVSLFNYCQNIGAYALVIFLSLFILYRKLTVRDEAKLFPTRFVYATALGSGASMLPVFVTLL